AVTVPSPAGEGVSTASIVFENRRVAAQVDANGISRRYRYSPNHTRVEVFDASGKMQSFWIQNFDDLGRNTGTTDAAGHTDRISYGPQQAP
ncbi:MAG TPA: hypothetical protein VGS41_06875, partial [Chthonomonadales bacterium]|nr:hypothetical protein [Chthonomonadales bacterium]